MEKAIRVPGLARGLRVIEYLVERQQGLSGSDISKALGYPTNSTMRILETLAHFGYVERNAESKTYRLSRKLFSMAYTMPKERTLTEVSIDMMKELRDAIGETVLLSILDQNEGLVIEQVQGTYPFRFVCDPGTRQALHASASTKAILSHYGKGELKAILDGYSFAKHTDTTITSRGDFLQELMQSRTDGYSFDRAEQINGVHCIASPLLDCNGYPVGAITVTGPSSRLNAEDLPIIGFMVKQKAEIISKRLGYLSNSNPLSITV